MRVWFLFPFLEVEVATHFVTRQAFPKGFGETFSCSENSLLVVTPSTGWCVETGTRDRPDSPLLSEIFSSFKMVFGNGKFLRSKGLF